jgi:hypothetical protein
MLRRCTGRSMGKIRQQLQALRGARLWVHAGTVRWRLS